MRDLVEAGDVVTILLKDDRLPCQVTEKDDSSVSVEPITSEAPDAESGPDIDPHALSGDLVNVEVQGDVQRRVKVDRVSDSVMQLRPSRLRHGNQRGESVCDCPGCWREAVPGTGTEKMVGTMVDHSYECPDCGLEWRDTTFLELARPYLD